jgi:hypothetical protein
MTEKGKRGLQPHFPGASEPKLPQISPALSTWLARLMHQVSPERLRANLEALPGPRNRLHAPDNMLQAEGLVQGWFQQANLGLSNGTGWQFSRRSYVLEKAAGFQDFEDFHAMVYPRLEGANLLAVKQGQNRRQALAVIAHLDTVRDSPGANDNGASIAAMVELARLLAPYRFKKTLILAVLDMEELGLLGARAIARELTREFDLRGVIDFETMAYTDDTPDSQRLPPGIEIIFRDQVERINFRERRGEFSALIYDGAATQLAATLAAGLAHLAGKEAVILLRDPKDLPLIGGLLKRSLPAVRNFARSDHAVFWEYGVPALMITDTANFRYAHYHLASDTPEKLNYQRLAEIVGATALTLARHAYLIE